MGCFQIGYEVFPLKGFHAFNCNSGQKEIIHYVIVLLNGHAVGLQF